MICSSGLPSCLSPVGKIPQPIIEKREKPREVAGRHGVDLRTAALQFSTTPNIASALIVDAASEQQIVADYSSNQVKIPAEVLGGAEGARAHRTGRACSRLTGSWGSHDARSMRNDWLSNDRRRPSLALFGLSVGA
jgi:hypothetical protein